MFSKSLFGSVIQTEPSGSKAKSITCSAPR
jgi:hypothetical protein